jgi:Protein of unknown function (DUF1688)
VESATAAAFSLLTAEAVRQRAHRLLALGLDDGLTHFRINPGRLEAAADLVIDTTRAAYPTLDVPFHSRWRHFVAGGEDRWATLAGATAWRDAAEQARAAFDLAVLSVLLDAGAGPQWAYRDPATGAQVGRSEGLALASFDMFAKGAFSSDPHAPLRADAAALQGLTVATLARHFQVTHSNPLLGVDGRVALLRRLGATIARHPGVFARADTPRPGGLSDHLARLAQGGSIPAPAVLREVLHHLGPIWPSRRTLGGIPLGDCWHHPAMTTDDATSGLVPLHKLSQWLTYSLLEPFEWAGHVVEGLEALTALPEYRNGGLLLDTGVIVPRDAMFARLRHRPADLPIIEWRALTVALIDVLATRVRARLMPTLAHDPAAAATALPLACLLEGGTWAAGRALAQRLRGGDPPILLDSDGTVF